MIKKQNGFTLIELLVVVAIIAVLMSMMLPALGNAKSYAVQAACSSNLKQSGTALMMYTGENQEVFPYDLLAWNDPRTSNLTNCYWQQLLLPYLGKNSQATVCSKYNLREVVSYLRGRPASQGGPVDITIDNMSLYNNYYWYCSGPFPMFGYNHLGLGCGGYAGYFGCVKMCLNGKYFVRTTVSSISNPSQMVAMIDNAFSYATPLWRSLADVDWQMLYFWPEEIRHRDQANISFVDGHIQSEKISANSKYLGVNSKQYWCENGEIRYTDRSKRSTGIE